LIVNIVGGKLQRAFDDELSRGSAIAMGGFATRSSVHDRTVIAAVAQE
jgi:hypothetical protein